MRCLSGGEALPRELARQLVERSAELWTCMGRRRPRSVDAVPDRDGRMPPAIGRRSRTQKCTVLASDEQPVPIGVPGELYIGGAGVARGYLNWPELTALRSCRTPSPRPRKYACTGMGGFARDIS